MESFTNSKNNSTNKVPEFLGLTDLISIAQNKKNDDPSMPIFPPEVIIEILTYMPIKSLTQLQLVCKDWRATIHDHYFIEKHMDRSQDVHHWHNVAQTTEDLKNSTPDRVNISYIHGSEGLLLMRNNNTQKFFIWNPATNGVLELPDPHDDYYEVAFSYVPATKSYKVVSVYNDEESGRECCEVFTPGHSETWKRLTFPENVNLNWQKEDKMVSVISSGGAVHCLLSVEVSNVTFEEVVSLDIETESFVVNSVPKSLFEDWTRVCALDWDGKLAFADIKGENLEVMELEDYRKQRWCGKKRVIDLAFMKNNGVAVSKLHPLFAKKSDIWFWFEDGYEKVFSYNIETRRRNDATQREGLSVANKNYPYKPSLVTFEGMQPDTKLEMYRPRL